MPRPRLVVVPGGASAPAGGAKEDSAADEELARRLAEGDRDALAAIYERHAPAIFRVLLRLLARTGDAEDVLQETFVIAFAKAGQLRERAALRGWLFRIAIREAHAKLRRRRRWSFFGGSRDDDDDVPLAHLVDEKASSDTRAELALLDRELAKLPPEQRIAWMLRHVEGEALEEVADACGCSLATAKRWLAAADQAVRRHVRIEEAHHDG